MAHLIQDEGNLCIDTERVDLGSLCTSATIDTGTLCMSGVDEKNLCTDLGASLITFFRADTTIITADNTSITADYAL